MHSMVTNQEIMPYLKCWAFAHKIGQRCRLGSPQEMFRAVMDLQHLHRTQPIAIRSACAWLFVGRDWSDLQEIESQFLLEIFDGAYEALSHTDAQLKHRAWGLYSLARRYEEQYRQRVGNNTVFFRRAIDCLNKALASPQLLLEFEAQPENFGSINAITQEFAPTLSNSPGRFAHALRNLRDQWQQELDQLIEPIQALPDL